MDYQITAMHPSDWPQGAAIYLEGIRTGLATFQAEVLSWEEWDSGHHQTCRLIARAGGDILGWAALSPFSKRPVYAGVGKISVYVSGKYRGLGVGKALLDALVAESERNGFWTLQSRIIRENAASIKLHERCGFRVVGVKERLGRMPGGRWHDVVLMERRSGTMGME